MIKGNVYFNTKDFQNSLAFYTKAYQFEKSLQHTQQSLDIAHNIALIKNIIGDDKEALAIFKENYNIYLKDEKAAPKIVNHWKFHARSLSFS